MYYNNHWQETLQTALSTRAGTLSWHVNGAQAEVGTGAEVEVES